MTTTHKANSIPTWQIVFLLLWPCLYFINAILPWSRQFMLHLDHRFWLPLFTGILVLHWLSVIIAINFLNSCNLSLIDIGYALNTRRTIWFVATYFLFGLGVYFYTKPALAHLVFNSRSIVLPQTQGERLFWIFASFSAGFCEEFIYRGFGISALTSKGMNKWLAVLITSVSFTFIHSFGALRSIGYFLYYFIFGFLMGAIFVETKKLWITMTIHMLWDLLIVFIMLYNT